jgi:hypothetical protein
MKISKHKDWLGKYLRIEMPNGEIYIERFFKELGISVRVKANTNQ